MDTHCLIDDTNIRRISLGKVCFKIIIIIFIVVKHFICIKLFKIHSKDIYKHYKRFRFQIHQKS